MCDKFCQLPYIFVKLGILEAIFDLVYRACPLLTGIPLMDLLARYSCEADGPFVYKNLAHFTNVDSLVLSSTETILSSFFFFLIKCIIFRFCCFSFCVPYCVPYYILAYGRTINHWANTIKYAIIIGCVSYVKRSRKHMRDVTKFIANASGVELVVGLWYRLPQDLHYHDVSDITLVPHRLVEWQACHGSRKCTQTASEGMICNRSHISSGTYFITIDRHFEFDLYISRFGTHHNSQYLCNCLLS